MDPFAWPVTLVGRKTSIILQGKEAIRDLAPRFASVKMTLLL